MLRRLRRNFGISAPRVSVRTHISWYWRLAATAVLLALALALAGWMYDTGSSFAGFNRRESNRELSDLRARIGLLQEESGRLREVVSASESKLQMERAARQALGEQVRQLGAENGRLREDLAIFENLAGGEAKAPGIEIPRLQIEPELTKGAYRYRMLLAILGLPKDKEFRGQLQFFVTALQNGKTVILPIPAHGQPDIQKYQVSFKRFQRVEGVIQVPVGAVVKEVEARLVQNGVVVATQRASL